MKRFAQDRASRVTAVLVPARRWAMGSMPARGPTSGDPTDTDEAPANFGVGAPRARIIINHHAAGARALACQGVNPSTIMDVDRPTGSPDGIH